MNSEGGAGESVGAGTGTGAGERSAGRDANATAGTDGADAGGYVHRPDGATPTDADAGDGSDVAAATTGRRGWVLVGVVVTCFLIVPGVVYLRPAAPGRLGLPFLAAMLVLPMLPAVILGLTAVWSMRGPRDRDRDAD